MLNICTAIGNPASLIASLELSDFDSKTLQTTGDDMEAELVIRGVRPGLVFSARLNRDEPDHEDDERRAICTLRLSLEDEDTCEVLELTDRDYATYSELRPMLRMLWAEGSLLEDLLDEHFEHAS